MKIGDIFVKKKLNCRVKPGLGRGGREMRRNFCRLLRSGTG